MRRSHGGAQRRVVGSERGRGGRRGDVRGGGRRLDVTRSAHESQRLETTIRIEQERARPVIEQSTATHTRDGVVGGGQVFAHPHPHTHALSHSLPPPPHPQPVAPPSSIRWRRCSSLSGPSTPCCRGGTPAASSAISQCNGYGRHGRTRPM